MMVPDYFAYLREEWDQAQVLIQRVDRSGPSGFWIVFGPDTWGAIYDDGEVLVEGWPS